MHTTRVNSKENAKSNDSDHVFVIRKNTCLKHRCPFKVHFLFLNIFLTRCQLVKEALSWEEKCLVTSILKRLYRKMVYIDKMMKLANLTMKFLQNSPKEVLN